MSANRLHVAVNSTHYWSGDKTARLPNVVLRRKYSKCTITLCPTNIPEMCFQDSLKMFRVNNRLDWIEQCFTFPPTQYRLYDRRFLQVKRPKQQHQSTEGTYRLHN